MSALPLSASLRRRAGATFLAAALVAAAAALVSSAAPAAGSTPASATVKIALDYTANVNYLGIYVAQSKGYFPLNISVTDVDENGPTATANVTATLANGAVKGPMPMTFVQGPSSTGWQLTQQSVADLSAVLG